MQKAWIRWLHHIVIFFGILFLIWGTIQKQTYILNKDEDVSGTAYFTTEKVSPGSVVYLHMSASNEMDARIIRNDNRDMRFLGNNTYYDQHLSAGGPPPEGNGVGTEVDLWTIASTETRYTILIKLPTHKSIDYTERDVKYTVECIIWTPNYPLIICGIVLIFSALTLGTVLGISLFGAGAVRVLPMPSIEEKEKKREEEIPIPTKKKVEVKEDVEVKEAMKEVPPPEPTIPSPFEPKLEVKPEDVEVKEKPKKKKVEWDTELPKKLEKPPEKDRRKPLKRIRCSACGAIIPIYTKERPLKITCPMCGRRGTLR